MNIKEQIEWLEQEAQRHSQSASDKAFTSRRRSTFKHRAKKLRGSADAMERLLAVHIAADKIFVHHSIGFDTDEEWATLSDALDVVNVSAVQTG